MISNYQSIASSEQASVALDCITGGIKAAHPTTVVDNTISVSNNHLVIKGDMIDLAEYDEVLIVGGGKASVSVVKTLEGILGDTIDAGVVVSPVSDSLDVIDVVQGSHPTPSEEGRVGTDKILEMAERADASTLIIAVITGGGSALLPAPVAGVTIDELTSLTNDLLTSGASIDEINAVRKHVSRIKGGRLAERGFPARILGILFSDVVGSNPSVIGSGPTAPDDSTVEEARDVLSRYNISPSQSIREYLSREQTVSSETPSRGSGVFDRVTNYVIADGWTALEGAADVARDAGYGVCVVSSRIEGIAREAGKMHVAIAEEAYRTGNPIDPPVVLLSGGETTVEVTGDGRGGPNLEFVVSAGMALNSDGIVVASVDTDGIDGNTDSAGAIVSPGTVSRSAGMKALAENNAYSLLDQEQALIKTGYTGTNVNDLRVMVVPSAGQF